MHEGNDRDGAGYGGCYWCVVNSSRFYNVKALAATVRS